MKISLVTPSYNQGRFLEACLRSILNQGYPDLEYFVLDGGSTDGSVEIIRRHAHRLSGWRSHPDDGQIPTLQEGFDLTTGEIMGWLNSDDMLTPWALRVVAEVFRRFPEVQWITSQYQMTVDGETRILGARRAEGFHAKLFYRGRNALIDPWFHTTFIQQESTFWRRSLWEKAGSRMDTRLRIVGDFELWSRFFQHAELYTVGTPLGIFRFHSGSGTVKEFDACMDVCRQILARFGCRYPSRLESIARKAARRWPEKIRRMTGLAVPVRHIVREGGETDFAIREEWIV
jgi:glycosyltransferase involved in cell wall biosynthesis